MKQKGFFMVFEGLTYGETIKNSRRKIFKVTQLIFEMKNYSKLQIFGKKPSSSFNYCKRVT